MKNITTSKEYHAIKESHSDRILFKHSPTCPISANAHKQVGLFAKENNTPIYLLDVLNTADTKYEIADDLGIEHESPQVIIFSKEKVQSHASHLSVTARWLRDEITGWNDTRK